MYFSSLTKVLCLFGAEFAVLEFGATSNFPQDRLSEMVAMLASILEKVLLKSYTSMQRHCVPNLVTEDLTA